MLKKSVNEFLSKPFNEFNSNWPILVAGDVNNGFNGMTVSWGGLGTLWNKPVAFVFVRKSRFTYEKIEKSDSVTLSFLNKDYLDAKKFFGTKSGRDVNKFEETNIHPTLDVDMNCYYIAEADYVLKMKKLYSVEIPFDKLPQDLIDRFYFNNDMHVMYVCEVKQYLVKEELYENN